MLGVAVGVMEADPSEADNITAYNIFGNIGTGPFNLDAEYMLGDVKGADHEHKGYSVQVSYALSNAPAGTWEFLYRYSTVEGTGDSNLISTKEIIRRANIREETTGSNADPLGGFKSVNKLNQNYVGVNYLFNGHDAKLLLGYEFNEAIDDLGKRGFHGPRAQVQFLF